jgi:hypothetical protein
MGAIFGLFFHNDDLLFHLGCLDPGDNFPDFTDLIVDRCYH